MDNGTRIRRCRCCGVKVETRHEVPIHTLCMFEHWENHMRGVQARRCKEFHTTNDGTKKPRQHNSGTRDIRDLLRESVMERVKNFWANF